jgi:hypothetical protein
MPLSVRIVWILYGTAAIRAVRKVEAVTRFALSTSCTKANLLVKSKQNDQRRKDQCRREIADCETSYPAVSSFPLRSFPMDFGADRSAGDDGAGKILLDCPLSGTGAQAAVKDLGRPTGR